MNVAILGCGPAGIFAAHAAAQQGHTVSIFSKNRKSHMRGAQYLHQPIPGLSGEPFKIEYRFEGDINTYRKKVYGDMSDIQVSPETLVGVADAWDIREAYDAGWERYRHLVRDYDMEIDQSTGFNVLDGIIDRNDLVISTVPARLLCMEPELHEFESARIWSTDYVKRIGVFAEEPVVDNIVICSGYEDDWWYRQSRIHGWENTEYPANAAPVTAQRIWAVEKPISTNCTCAGNILLEGRYGRWQKGVLSHEAYYNTINNLEKM